MGNESNAIATRCRVSVKIPYPRQSALDAIIRQEVPNQLDLYQYTGLDTLLQEH
jgi:hypothetical protein